MPECPNCHQYFKPRGKIRSEARQRARSIQYIGQIMDLLGLSVSKPDIERAVETLFSEWYARRRGNNITDEPITGLNTKTKLTKE